MLLGCFEGNPLVNTNFKRHVFFNSRYRQAYFLKSSYVACYVLIILCIENIMVAFS